MESEMDIGSYSYERKSMNEKATEDPCKINSRSGCDHDRNQYCRKILRAVFPEMRTLHQKDPAQNQAGHGKVFKWDSFARQRC